MKNGRFLQAKFKMQHKIEPPKDAAPHIVQRCQMVQDVLNGATAVEVAGLFGVTPPTLYKYKKLYLSGGLAALLSTRKKTRNNKTRPTLQVLSYALQSDNFTANEKRRVEALIRVWGGLVKLKDAASELGMTPQGLQSFRQNIYKKL